MTREEARRQIEIMRHWVDGGEVESSPYYKEDWKKVAIPAFDWGERRYRKSKKSTMKTVPLGPGDIPPVYWIRTSLWDRESRGLVYAVRSHGIVSNCGYISWADLCEHYEGSTDLETWTPCRKEVEEQ